MSAPTPPAPRGAPSTARKPWYLRPAITVPAILALIVLVALLTPEPVTGRSGDARLTTYSSGPQGARLLYELADRLGWRVERWTASSTTPTDPRSIVAVFEPTAAPSAIETHDLLEGVRAGGSLFYVMNAAGPLNDSLRVQLLFGGGSYQPAAAGTVDRPSTPAVKIEAPRRRAPHDSASADSADDAEAAAAAECARTKADGGAAPLWPNDEILLYRIGWVGERPRDVIVFARAGRPTVPTAQGAIHDSTLSRPAPAAVGFPLGRGRVVVVSDADMLRNDVLRVCHWGIDVVAVRMLEYLSGGNGARRDRIVFDEYHQGYGTHPGTLRAIATYLGRAPSGHVLLQALLGGVVLLLALGPRALPPHDAERVERRSPLEHVAALAQAYSNVGATRTATGRLLHGVRRRTQRAVQSSAARTAEVADDAFLDSAARALPERAADVALIRRALTTRVTRRELVAVGDALKRLESSLMTSRR